MARMTPVHFSVDDITVVTVFGVVLAFFIAQKAVRLLDKYFSERWNMNEKTNLPALQKTDAKTCDSQAANSKKGGSKTRQVPDASHLPAVVLCAARTEARCIEYGRFNTSLCACGVGGY